MKAFVTGVSGQVGSYLVEYLLNKGYTVVGLNRRKSINNFGNIPTKVLENPKFSMVEGELTDTTFVNNYFRLNKFDELYNLAAQSHVHTSFEQPQLTFQVNTTGVLNLLEAIRTYMPDCRMYQASTSEMFGGSLPPQNMKTVFHPRSPYGCAKLAAHWLVDVYRDSYGLNVACGVMFNTESPRRGDNFVTKKIVNYVKKYREHCLHTPNAPIEPLHLGNLDAKRDWVHVSDSVEAIYRICNQTQYNNNNYEVFKDFTFGSGKATSVRDFLTSCLNFAFRDNNRFIFKGDGLAERLLDLDFHNPAEGRTILVIDSKFFRPAEVEYLLCDPSEIKNVLEWEPKVSFDDLVADMFLGK